MPASRISPLSGTDRMSTSRPSSGLSDQLQGEIWIQAGVHSDIPTREMWMLINLHYLARFSSVTVPPTDHVWVLLIALCVSCYSFNHTCNWYPRNKERQGEGEGELVKGGWDAEHIKKKVVFFAKYNQYLFHYGNLIGCLILLHLP